MNNINFQQVGGFPMETNTLLEVQKAYSIFNALGYMAGGRVIISGCVKTGNEISNGYLFIDGELIEFRGGTEQSKVIIKQEIQEVEFEDRQLKPVYYTRYATFGTGVTTIDWSDFKRLDSVVRLMERITTLENQTIPDAVLPATQAEVNARSITTKYVSPKTLPAETIIMSGEVSAVGSKVSYFKKSFTSSRIGVGFYRINHGIGNQKYGVIGSGVNSPTLKVSLWQRFNSYCIIGLSDDSSVNDGNFSFQIFKTAP